MREERIGARHGGRAGDGIGALAHDHNALTLEAVRVAVHEFGELVGARGRVVARALVRERLDDELVQPGHAAVRFHAATTMSGRRQILTTCCCCLGRSSVTQVIDGLVEPLRKRDLSIRNAMQH